jgi:predicted metalloprotease with PDZ domain
MASARKPHPGPDVWYSLGLRMKNDGTITDVRWGSPADNAKLVPGSKIIAVDGIIFSTDSLKAAIKQSKDNTTPIHLILRTDQFVTLADINYHGGERYPSLERVEGTPNYLDDITQPLTKPQTAPAKSE